MEQEKIPNDILDDMKRTSKMACDMGGSVDTRLQRNWEFGAIWMFNRLHQTRLSPTPAPQGLSKEDALLHILSKYFTIQHDESISTTSFMLIAAMEEYKSQSTQIEQD